MIARLITHLFSLILLFGFLSLNTAHGAHYYVAFEKGDLTDNIQSLPSDIKVIQTFSHLDLLLVSSTDKPHLKNTKFVNSRPTQWKGNTSTDQTPDTLSPNDFQIPWGVNAIQAPQVWTEGVRGQGVKVLLLDSGISKEHPALQNRIRKARDFTKSQVSLGIPYPEYDISGHGTHIAATILGNGHNGLYGVAPEAELYVGKVCVFLCENLDNLIEAIEWGLDQKVQVINMSFSSARMENWKSLGPHIFEKLEEKGVVVVASAGNRGLIDGKILFPANMKNVISVGALDKNAELAEFSSYGKDLDILAPGKGITSASLTRGINSSPNLRIEKDGTSMAAPHVTGTVALILSACPNLLPAQVRELILRSADNGPVHDKELYRVGRLNAGRAVQLLNSNCLF